jgi:hypothetical protein
MVFNSVPLLVAKDLMLFGSQTYLPDIGGPLQFTKSYREILEAKETYKENITVQLAKRVADYTA